MADRTFYPVGATDNELKLVMTSFTSLGTSNPTTFDTKHISSVTRNGVGDWTVTFNDTYASVKSAVASGEDSALTDLTAQIKAKTTSTVRVLLYDGGAASDGTSGNTVVNLVVGMKNSSV